jgi:hypothetical protein
MVRPATGLGEAVELGVLPDHRVDPLARGSLQLLERDLADDPVAEVAPGEGWQGMEEDSDGAQQRQVRVHQPERDEVWPGGDLPKQPFVNHQPAISWSSSARRPAVEAVPVIDLSHAAEAALGRMLDGRVVGRDGDGRRLLVVAVDDWVIDWFGTRPPSDKGCRQRGR